jgi:ribosomal protein S12 methylthiotransferase
MALQQSISAAKLKQKIGTTQTILIDSVTDDGATGRTYADAPEIDGLVHLPGVTEFQPGDWVEAEIAAADDYDLWVS